MARHPHRRASEWRQDAFYRRAAREGYRSRAAYKLLELQSKYRLLRPGQRVLDLGSRPGSWLQVAAREIGPRGRLVGIDLAPVTPLACPNPPTVLQGDFTSPDVAAQLQRTLGAAADLVLCDAAPKLTGIRSADRAREEALWQAVERELPVWLRPGGGLVLKLFDSPEAVRAARSLRGRFRSAFVRGLLATRSGSGERYFLGRDFIGERTAVGA